MLNFEEIQYNLKSFRTKKTYIAFLAFQLILAVSIIPVALSRPKHFRSPFVIFLEFLLFLMLTFDLYTFINAE